MGEDEGRSQTCNESGHAHEREVVHRDIKPDNIFLLYDGRVKVADFGIARVMGSSTMTQAGTVMGTPGYMSPEQGRGERTDSRTDIFATGVILYELLTGTRAFAADSLTAVMYRTVNEDPLPLMQIDPSLPVWLQRVVSCATAKDPELRYPDASAMISDLAARGEAPLPAPSPSSPPTVMLAQQEEKEEAPGTVLRPPSAPLPVPEGMSASPAPSRRKTYLIASITSVCVLLVVGGAILALLLLTSSRVTVPDLEGVDASEARSLLEKSGLAMEEEEVSYPGFSEGEVVSQVPAAGQKVEKGSGRKVEVNRGDAAISQDGERTDGFTQTMDAMISELASLESQIKNLATEINKNIDPTNHRMKKDLKPQCDALMGSLNGLKSRASVLAVPQEFDAVHWQFLQLVGYCIERVNAFYAGIIAVESGGITRAPSSKESPPRKPTALSSRNFSHNTADLKDKRTSIRPNPEPGLSLCRR